MLETIRAILEFILKPLVELDFAEWRRRRQLRKLGTEMFILYLRLNQVLMCGQRIFDHLQQCVSRLDETGFLADDWERAMRKSLAEMIAEQRSNIHAFLRSVLDLHYQVQVLDADVYRKLLFLIEDKIGALSTLRRLLEEHRFPLSPPTTAELVDMANMALEPARNPRRALFEQGRPRHLLLEVRKAMREGSLGVSQPWGRDDYERIKRYLRDRDPGGQLAELETALQKLRTALELNFSVKDVLLDVGDLRLRR